MTARDLWRKRWVRLTALEGGTCVAAPAREHHREAGRHRRGELLHLAPRQRSVEVVEDDEERQPRRRPVRLDDASGTGAALGRKLDRRRIREKKANVAIAQRRGPVAVVVARVLAIADANPRGVEQADDRSQHFLARQAVPEKIEPDTAAQPRRTSNRGARAGSTRIIGCGPGARR